jgi:tRNA pseudouridine55 synthase
VALGIDAARALAGALLIDKPAGPTSHDVVAFVRRTLKTSRVGHTGTLDPLATGLLVVLVGQATRIARFLAADEKEYIADMRLGVSTPTYDAASLPPDIRYPIPDVRYPTDAEIEVVLARYRGTFLQTPPPYSAKKIASVPAYEKARKNQPVDLKPVQVTVSELQVVCTSDIGYRTSDLGRGLLRVRVAASAGFYVRSLAHDIGQALGCGAHLEALRRTRVGRFRIEDALTLDLVESRGTDALLPLNALLGEMPAIRLTAEGVKRALHGNYLRAGLMDPEEWAVAARWLVSEADSPYVRLLDGNGTVVAVAELRRDGCLHPVVVLS